ncbi:hypothetical protein HQN60_13915 [Deefgea piscis]|uniref:Lipoprotein n=1 Tax=Deefgea piscis TaxID=2739061 RepID=A0A6M8SUD0_9NEIS|nr:hypothetical protein [Deefgea piscis]QKJ67724.1 hypothetical protein HQN60_13915 [Deefgea piscis]
MQKSSFICSISLLLTLAACGGGGGGGGTASPTPVAPASPTATPIPSQSAYQSLSDVKVGSNMRWQLSSRKNLSLSVKYSNNSLATGVVIKLFTYTTTDPHASQAPASVTSSPSEAVALALIDTVLTDSNGQATWEVELANSQTSVLAIISDGTQTQTQIIQLDQTGPINLTL